MKTRCLTRVMTGMSEGFDPRSHDRPPRSRGYQSETQKICRHLMNRGDQRIGQFIINSVRVHFIDEIEEELDEPDRTEFETTEEYVEALKKYIVERESAYYSKIWNLEAPELLEAIEDVQGGLPCVECGNEFTEGSDYRCRSCLDELFEKGVSIDSGN